MVNEDGFKVRAGEIEEVFNIQFKWLMIYGRIDSNKFQNELIHNYKGKLDRYLRVLHHAIKLYGYEPYELVNRTKELINEPSTRLNTNPL